MRNKSVIWIVYLVLCMVYIVPNGLIFGAFSAVHNHIFAAIVGVMYIVPKIRKGKFRQTELRIWLIIIAVALYTKRLGFIDMIIIPALGEFLKKKDIIKRTIYKSNIPYVAILFTLIYTIIYRTFGIGGRGEGAVGSGLLFSAIGEINLTGLSMFCLAVIIRKKSKLIGYAVAALGILTISRSYILALVCVVFFNLPLTKRLVDKVIGKLTYFNLTLLSSVAMFVMSLISIYMFTDGAIADYSTSSGFARLFKFNDYSNYFRFLAIYIIVMIIVRYPFVSVLGFSDEQFWEYGHELATSQGFLFTEIGTHNLFFSHLKMYGIGVFLEIHYISKYLKQIITRNNFGIFFAVFCYCVILGTGLSSYWLFLTAIMLVMYE